MADRSALEGFAARMSGLRGRDALDATAVTVIGAFERAGVGAILLKGPALARLLYTEGETRGYSDVDLIVDPAKVGAARAALVALGFTEVSRELGVEDVGGVVHAETWVGPDPAGHETVDLHLRLPGTGAPPAAVWAALEQHRTELELSGCAIAVLDRAGLAFHVATHAAQHGPEVSKPLTDLETALGRWDLAVWTGAAALAREVDAVGVFAAGLRLVPAGAERAGELALPATPGRDWELAMKAQRPRGTFHVQAFREASGVRQRAALLTRALFPSRRWILAQYPSAHRGRAWVLAAYAGHLARTPVWALRALRYSQRARKRAAG